MESYILDHKKTLERVGDALFSERRIESPQLAVVGYTELEGKAYADRLGPHWGIRCS